MQSCCETFPEKPLTLKWQATTENLVYIAIKTEDFFLTVAK